MTPEQRQAIESVIAEMRERVILDGPLPEQNDIEVWADRLALLVEVHQLQDTKDVTTRGVDTQYGAPLATASENQTALATAPLEATCMDCGLDYSDFGMDVLLQRSQWLEIHPVEHGLLCALCITKRAAKLPGAVALRATIVITPCKGEASING